jgi:hypothetical protein
MVRVINRGTCIKAGCTDEAFFKRLCRSHYRLEAGSGDVKDYCFTWNVIESFEGTVRATSEDEALRLVKAGIAAGSRTVLGPKPCNIELIGINEC